MRSPRGMNVATDFHRDRTAAQPGDRYLRVLPWIALMILSSGARAQPAVLPNPGELDESVFREGLRQRGLSTWLEQYEADTPAIDEIDAELRRREKLLTEADTLLPAERARRIERADRILIALLAEHPEHRYRMRWQLERARDLIERLDPTAFDRLLLYELGGRDRQRV